VDAYKSSRGFLMLKIMARVKFTDGETDLDVWTNEGLIFIDIHNDNDYPNYIGLDPLTAERLVVRINEAIEEVKDVRLD
jgi:hypothetical protein